MWRTEAKSAGTNDIAHNHATSVAREVAGACWLASVLRSLPRNGLIRRWLEALAPYSADALLRFRMTDANDDDAGPAHDAAPDLETSARQCADECGREELAAFLRRWRNGTDLMTEVIANELSHGVGRSMRVLHRFCEALCQVAIGSSPELEQLPWEDQLTRAETLLRLDRNDEAVELLTKVLPDVPEESRSRAVQLLAFTANDDPSATAIDRLTQEIARESEPMRKAHLVYNRGRLRVSREAWQKRPRISPQL